jgi:hypothetical protein
LFAVKINGRFHAGTRTLRRFPRVMTLAAVAIGGLTLDTMAGNPASLSNLMTWRLTLAGGSSASMASATNSECTFSFLTGMIVLLRLPFYHRRWSGRSFFRSGKI